MTFFSSRSKEGEVSADSIYSAVRTLVRGNFTAEAQRRRVPQGKAKSIVCSLQAAYSESTSGSSIMHFFAVLLASASLRWNLDLFVICLPAEAHAVHAGGVLVIWNFYACGSSSVGRATASQAVGRGFETRFPLIWLTVHRIVSKRKSQGSDLAFYR